MVVCLERYSLIAADMADVPAETPARLMRFYRVLLVLLVADGLASVVTVALVSTNPLVSAFPVIEWVWELLAQVVFFGAMGFFAVSKHRSIVNLINAHKILPRVAVEIGSVEWWLAGGFVLSNTLYDVSMLVQVVLIKCNGACLPDYWALFVFSIAAVVIDVLLVAWAIWNRCRWTTKAADYQVL